ncbi:MAG: M4 family metallopeptidase [Bacteroidia bacterium]|nr:M4 family metallopeptidase [Bacteroidia bacterium]
MKTINLLLINLFISVILFGQKPNKEMDSIAELNYGNGWLELKKELNIRASSIFKDHKSAFKLSINDEMQVKKSESDDLGFTHYRFQQTYKGVIIEGAEYIIHEKGNKAIKANGKIVAGLDIVVNPSVSEEEAINIALISIPAEKYMWEDEAEENLLKEIKKDPNATHYPQPELLITLKDDNADFLPENFLLAYKINIYTKEPYDGYSVYINAHNGEVIKKTPLILHTFDVIACTLYNGTQTIITDIDQSSLDYILFDDTRGDNGILTEDVSNADNIWTTDYCEYTQTHWAGEMTYDYFWQKHGRKSYDNNDALMTQKVGGSCFGSSYWSPLGEYIMICENYEYCNNWMNSLDVVGHEWTHGVVQYSVGYPPYSVEFRALNESFGDIFGTMIEFYAEELYDVNHVDDWLIGEDFWKPEFDGYIRSMQDPKNKPLDPDNAQSDTYYGEYWYDPNGVDPIRAHIRCGVQNYWFYLLSEGGSGTNDNGDSYNVTSIGRDKAAAIAYRNLTVYLVSSSDHADARQGAIESAIDLYGECSEEVLQTVEAWNAVGVYAYPIAENIYVCGDIPEYYGGKTGNNKGEGNGNGNGNGGPTDYLKIFIAANGIYAGAEVCTSSTFTTIHQGHTVVFKAGNEIILGPDFIAEAGSDFHAYIFTCPEISYKSLNENNEPEQPNYQNNTLSINNPIDLIIYPNPFTTTTQISYQITKEEEINIELFDIFGRRIKTLVAMPKHPKGEFYYVLESEKLLPGIYICYFKTLTRTISQKIILLK